MTAYPKTYTRPDTGEIVHLWTAPIPVLIGQLKYLVFRSGAEDWLDQNPPETVPALCRALRIRIRMTEGVAPRGRLMAWLNTLDPPPCQCGRLGLYIVGETTYCRRCRPQAVQRRVVHGQRLEEGCEEKTLAIQRQVKRELRRREFHANSALGRQGR